MNPWVILAEIGTAVALHYLQEWMSDPPPDAAEKKLANVPQVTPGSAVPMVFGTFRVRRPCLAWYGGFRQFSTDLLPAVAGRYDPTTYYPWNAINLLFVVGLPHSPIAANTGARLVGLYFGDGGEQKLELNLGDTQTQKIGSASLGRTPFGPAVGLVQFFAGGSGQAISDNIPRGPYINEGDDDSDITEISRFMRRVPIDPNLIPGYKNQMLVALTGDHNLHLVVDSNGVTEVEDGDNPGHVLSAFAFGPDMALPEISFEVTTRHGSFPPTFDVFAALMEAS
jgi:hypothetical protein